MTRSMIIERAIESALSARTPQDRVSALIKTAANLAAEEQLRFADAAAPEIEAIADQAARSLLRDRVAELRAAAAVGLVGKAGDAQTREARLEEAVAAIDAVSDGTVRAGYFGMIARVLPVDPA